MGSRRTAGTSRHLLTAGQSGDPEQAGHVGNQAGERVFLFLHTDDFWQAFDEMRACGIQFPEDPRQEPYGTVAGS